MPRNATSMSSQRSNFTATFMTFSESRSILTLLIFLTVESSIQQIQR